MSCVFTKDSGSNWVGENIRTTKRVIILPYLLKFPFVGMLCDVHKRPQLYSSSLCFSR